PCSVVSLEHGHVAVGVPVDRLTVALLDLRGATMRLRRRRCLRGLTAHLVRVPCRESPVEATEASTDRVSPVLAVCGVHAREDLRAALQVILLQRIVRLLIREQVLVLHPPIRTRRLLTPRRVGVLRP